MLRAPVSAPHLLASPDITALVPLFAPYLSNQHSEVAAIAGFDALGRLHHFVECIGLHSYVPDLRSAFRSVLGTVAVTEIIMAHSHPDAPATPSRQDQLTTERLSALARLGGAALTDHLIFGTDGIHSIAENRLVMGVVPLQRRNWSGREDSNLRPLPPEDSALPG
jgi:hypothetical protein